MGNGAFCPHAKEGNIISIGNIPTVKNVIPGKTVIISKLRYEK